MCRLLAAALVAAVVAGCQIPTDPEGTLERATGGVLAVGVVDAPPWVELDASAPPGVEPRPIRAAADQPQGVEPRLIRAFADTIDAEVEWVRGSEAELVAALEGGQLDVVLAGFTRKSPYRRKVALTRPYVSAELVLAAPRDVEPPDDLDGYEVAVEAHSPAAAVLEQKTDADPVQRESLQGVSRPALVWDYWLDDLPLEPTGRALAKEEHSFAVRRGENRFLVELEGFLLDREAKARDLLEWEGNP